MTPTVYIIDFIALIALLSIASRKGVEAALPSFAFMTILIPVSNKIEIPGVFNLTTQRLLLLLLLLCYVLFRRKPENETAPVPLPLKLLIILQVIWCMLSTANSIEPVASIKKMISVVVEYYILYVVFFRSVTSVKSIQRILQAMVLAIVIVSVFGAVESYSNWRISDMFPAYGSNFITVGDSGEQVGRGSRIESTFPHPILLAAGIATILPIALYLTSIAEKNSQKILLWLGIFVMFLSLYKSQSRGPWMAAILSFALLIPWGGARIRKYMMVIAFLCVAVMIVRPGVYDTIAGIYQATMDPQSPMGSSYQYRFALKDVAIRALAKSPGRALWGYGMETFYELRLTGPFLGRDDHPFLSCDSAWIEIMVETGYVGLALFASILLGSGYAALRGYFKLPEELRSLSWIFFICMAGYYFMMTSVAMYSWGQNGYILWMLVGLSAALWKIGKTQKTAEAAAPVRTPSRWEHIQSPKHELQRVAS